jgi:hypothetical protein
MAWYGSIAKRYRAQEAPTNPKDLKTKRAGIVFVPGGGGTGGRGQFEKPTVGFDEIQNAYETDSYIRQALDKYIYLMFKEGYQFVSKNPKAVEYINARLRLMAFGVGTSPNDLFVEVASTLVKNANVFLIKARQDIKAKIPGLNVKPIQGIGKPVAGYFVQNTSTVTISRDIMVISRLTELKFLEQTKLISSRKI